MRTIQLVGYLNGRHRRRLSRLHGFLVDQREDAVTTLPACPPQFVPVRNVPLMERAVICRPPPAPRPRARIGHGEPSGCGGLEPGDQLETVGGCVLRPLGVTGQPPLLRPDLLRVLAVLEELTAVRCHHRDVVVPAPAPLDQPALLKSPGCVRAAGRDGKRAWCRCDLAEQTCLLLRQRVLHGRLHLDKPWAEYQSRAAGRPENALSDTFGFHRPNRPRVGTWLV